jgi:hypothetical protein
MLISADKLEAAISAYEDALIALASAEEYTIDTGGKRILVRRSDIPKIRETLRELQSQKSSASGKSYGRTYAKQGGRG